MHTLFCDDEERETEMDVKLVRRSGETSCLSYNVGVRNTDIVKLLHTLDGHELFSATVNPELSNKLSQK